MLKSKHSIFFAALFFVFNVVNLNLYGTSSVKICDHRYLNDEIKIDGKVVIVTGGSSGMGLETAKNLAKRGGRIYIASRNEKKGNESAEGIRQSTGNDNVQFIKLDLGSLKSVREFSETFHRIENRLDILINNAGIASQYQKTEDGFEMNIGVNHLGHFLLTNLLLDLMEVAAPSRVIVVSSLAYEFGEIIQGNLNSEVYFPGIIKAYGNSKLANILFTQEMARRLEKSSITVNSLHPGFAKSELGKDLPSILRMVVQYLQKLIGRSFEHASQTHVMLALDPSVNEVSGKYFFDCVEQQLPDFARDENMAHWLWAESAKLTKLDQ